MNIRDDIILEDTTLRDGKQSPGVAFSKATKFAIHDALVEAGVKWIEVGIPAMGGDELDFLQELSARGSDARLIAWNRGVKDDVKQSLDLGYTAIHIGLPASDIHLKDSIRKDRSWLIQQAKDLVKYAKDRGAFVSISAEDVGRSDIQFLQEYAGYVYEAGANRLRLSDTIGILTPEKYSSIISSIRKACEIDLQCHAHNDFGFATANTIAGLQAGARYFHVTINSIGERAGMPDFAQVVMSLELLYGVKTGIKLEHLKHLGELIQHATRAQCPPWQPIIGKNVFAHESGIHANATIRNSATFEPFPPELISGERKIVVGKHSGKAALKYVLEQEGVVVQEEKLGLCLEMVRNFSMNQERALTNNELLDIYLNKVT